MGLARCPDRFRYSNNAAMRQWSAAVAGALTHLENSIVSFAQQAGIRVRVTSRCRTWEEQNALYCSRGSSLAAAPGTSQHEWGTAFDCVPELAGLQRYGASLREGYAWLVNVARALGADGIAESDHAHIQLYRNEDWRNFLAWVRDSGGGTLEGITSPILIRAPQCGGRSGGAGSGATFITPIPIFPDLIPRNPAPTIGRPRPTPVIAQPAPSVPPGVAPPGQCVPGAQIFGIPGAYWTECRDNDDL